MLGKPHILSLFLNLFNKFNNTLNPHDRYSIKFLYSPVSGLIVNVNVVVNFHVSIKCKVQYGRCSEILNTSCMLIRPRQTVQTQIRLLLKK